MSRFARSGAALLAATLPLTAVPSGAAARPSPPCSYVAVSPDFARDRTGACTYVQPGDDDQPYVYTTRDGGRSWQRAAATGLPPDTDATPHVRPVFSPRYAADRTLYVVTGDGVFESTDLAATFRLVDPLVRQGSGNNPAVLVGSAPPPVDSAAPGERVLLAGAYGERSAMYDSGTGLHLPVPGARGGMRYFATPTWPSAQAPPLALVLDDRPTAENPYASGYTAYGCTEALACTEPRFSFPNGLYLDGVEVGQWGGQVVYVTLMHNLASGIWYPRRSTDGGRTFTPWRSLDAILNATGRGVGGNAPAVSLAPDPSSPGVWWVRVNAGPSGLWTDRMPPTEQVFVSDRRGDGWRRVAYQRDPDQRGQRGTLPWNTGTSSRGADLYQLVAAPAGKLFAVGRHWEKDDRVGQTAVWCSTNGGRTWRMLCDR